MISIFLTAVSATFLIISQPHIATLSYVSINEQNVASAPKILINTGLTNPLGVALDANNNFLYVSDTGARNIFRYKLIVSNGALVTDEAQHIAAANVEARWISVDEFVTTRLARCFLMHLWQHSIHGGGSANS